MKKIVLTFGLIGGVILSAWMLLITLRFEGAVSDEYGLILGYTSMVLAFMLIYFGVRSYRDNVAGGTVRFGRAFMVGALIGLVGSLCYVATWEVVYFNFHPDFLTKYSARQLEKARVGGATAEQLAKQKAEMDEFMVQYQNPAFNAVVTLAEPLPVALVIALVSAGVLSRKKREDVPGDAFGRVAG